MYRLSIHEIPILDSFKKVYPTIRRGRNVAPVSQRIRTSKKVTGTTHYYTLNGSQILTEQWGNIFIVYLYDESGSPIGMQYRTDSMTEGTFYTYLFEKNLQGDIIAVYNTSGTKLISYVYDAWGNVTVTNHNVSGTNSGARHNPFRYRGYYYDTETGYYYLQSRYYNPEWGRFISPDSFDIIGSTTDDLYDNNLYSYCDNNPVMRVDDGGKFWNFIIGGVVGGIAGGVIAAINGGDISDIVIGTLSGAASGVVAASGLGMLAQAGISAAISGVADIANQTVGIIESGGSITDIDLLHAGGEAVLGGVTSMAGSMLGKLNGSKIMKTQVVSDTAFDKYLGKTFTAGIRQEAGRSSSALLRQANKFLAKSVLYDNITKGWSSVIGSTISLWSIAR